MKFSKLEHFNGCYNLRFGGQSRSKEAVLFLHGFPAEQGNKNIDVAEMIQDEFGLDTYLIHYRGLGESEDKFGFTRAIEDSCAYAEKLISEYGYSHVHLIGHSFGGWVASEVFKRLEKKRGLLVLLAPFTEIADGDEGPAQLALYFMRHYPHVISANRFNEVTSDLTKMRETMHPQQTARKLSDHAGDVLIINSVHDEIIPQETIDRVADAWGARVARVDLDTDHRFFRNREMLHKEIREFFRGKL